MENNQIKEETENTEKEMPSIFLKPKKYNIVLAIIIFVLSFLILILTKYWIIPISADLLTYILVLFLTPAFLIGFAGFPDFLSFFYQPSEFSGFFDLFFIFISLILVFLWIYFIASLLSKLFPLDTMKKFFKPEKYKLIIAALIFVFSFMLIFLDELRFISIRSGDLLEYFLLFIFIPIFIFIDSGFANFISFIFETPDYSGLADFFFMNLSLIFMVMWIYLIACLLRKLFSSNMKNIKLSKIVFFIPFIFLIILIGIFISISNDYNKEENLFGCSFPTHECICYGLLNEISYFQTDYNCGGIELCRTLSDKKRWETLVGCGSTTGSYNVVVGLNHPSEKDKGSPFGVKRGENITLPYIIKNPDFELENFKLEIECNSARFPPYHREEDIICDSKEECKEFCGDWVNFSHDKRKINNVGEIEIYTGKFEIQVPEDAKTGRYKFGLRVITSSQGSPDRINAWSNFFVYVGH